MKPYYHEMSDEEFKILLSKNNIRTWDRVLEVCSQPFWCLQERVFEHTSIEPCYYLMDRKIKSVADCLKCKCSHIRINLELIEKQNLEEME
jgi:hypothetical protein